MSQGSARRWMMKKLFEGKPKLEDFELGSVSLSALKDKEILIKPEVWSVDPYARKFPQSFGCKMPMTMLGSEVSKVVESRHPLYPVDSYTLSYTGWRDLVIVNPDSQRSDVSILPTLSQAFPLPQGLPKSLLLGTVGMPGNSAYFGFFDLLKPREGETVVISGAAGAVGSLVGQLGKITGCRAVGIAGSGHKCKYLVEELGFDAAVNYREEDFITKLEEALPDGVDCYFDNVGGDISLHVIKNMNKHGRIAVCGASSEYNEHNLIKPIQGLFINPQLKMEGLNVFSYLSEEGGRWEEGLQHMANWVAQGMIKADETVVEGFENLPSAFIRIMEGDSVGKLVVKAV